jgi:uncharacterized protein (DUF1800 family)
MVLTMRIFKQRVDFSRGIAGRGLALISAVALLASAFSVFPRDLGAEQKQQRQATRLTEEQRILHVLNRLGFGARPGDVERVKAMGVENYISQQLHPEKIADAAAEAKVKDLATLSMTTAELYEKFPQPGQLLKQLQRRGDLPAGLADAQKNRVKGTRNAATQNPSQPGAGAAMTPEAMAKNDETAKGNQPALQPQENEEYRRAIREYYMQNGLQPPQRITAELQASRILRAAYSERQLQEVIVDFWTNHFNVFAGKGADRWLLVSYDRDTIRAHSLGKFSDLLLATAQSPAMLFYLDNYQSVSPNAAAGQRTGQRGAQRDSLLRILMGGRGRADRIMDRYPNIRRQQGGSVANTPQGSAGANMPQRAGNAAQQRKRGINENYARELMELHTLGVDGGYTQKDVQEVARCFTGWTIFAPRGGGVAAAALMGDASRDNAGKFYFNPRQHDEGEKTVLGHKIPAGGGMKDGLMVLDILAHHHATSRFIATKLVRHFVMDNAPPALVDRVAAAFTRSDGDIRETLKSIFFSPEFNVPEAYRAKVKRPFELAISAIRTLGADTNGGPQLHQWIARMGEPLYGFQTPNGYSDTAESWVNTGGLLERLNFGLSLASNRIPGTRVDLKRFLASTPNSPPLDKAQIMDRFLNLIIAGETSAKTKETLIKQLNEQASVAAQTMEPGAISIRDNTVDKMSANNIRGPQARGRELARDDANIADPVTKIVGLILGSPEFQRQ